MSSNLKNIPNEMDTIEDEDIMYVGESDGVGGSQDAKIKASTIGNIGNPIWLAGASISSDATVEFNEHIDSTYDWYIFEFLRVLPDTDAVDLRSRFSDDGGSTWKSAYIAHITTASDDSATPLGASSTGTSIYANISHTVSPSNVGTSSSKGYSGFVWLLNPSSSTKRCMMYFEAIYGRAVITDGICFSTGGCADNVATNVINAIEFFPESGVLTSGDINMYGIKQ
jgi:hypothetical protein